MIRGILVYTGIAIFCLAVWALTITIVWRYGWIGGAALAIALLAIYEIVFTDLGPEEEDDELYVSDIVGSRDEAAA